MKLPYMRSDTPKTKQQIIAFAGVNYGLGAKDGELAECTNLSSARYPCLSQRDGRKVAGSYASPTGLYARGKLCVVDGTDLIYDGKVVGQVEAGEKQFAAINTKIVIFPDKVYYDTANGNFERLEANRICYAGDAAFTESTLTVPEMSWIAVEGVLVYALIPAGTSVNTFTKVTVNKETGALDKTGEAVKTSEQIKAGDFMQYECNTATEYQEVKSTELKEDGTWQIGYILYRAEHYSYPDFQRDFRPGDAVEISGCTTFPANNGSHIIRAISGRTLTFTANIFPKAGTEASAVIISRRVPDLSCLCECDNRIWGASGSTIYSSALGDPTNFNIFDGLATDSFSVAVGTEGDFTGCIAYSSTVLFWKEDCLHKVLGSYPAQYEIYTYRVPGIQKGCEKSPIIINETLYYKGRNGVYAYAGGTPELISECFGTRRFSRAVGGSDGERYYLSMLDEGGAWDLYVYDTLRNIWLREDNTHALDWAYLDGKLHYLDGASGKLVTMGETHEEEGPVEWSATLCQMDETTHGRKGYSRLYLRADMAAGAWMRAEISLDGRPFREIWNGHNERAKTVVIPILPVRCDNFRLRLSGKGECVVKSIVREFAVGSEY